MSAWSSTTIGRRPSMVGTTAEPGNAGAPVGEEHRRRIGNRDEAGADHLEQPEFVRRAEAVLDRAEQAERMVAIALELEHRVDDVFEDARAGEVAVLGDVADEHDRRCCAPSPR